MLPVSSSQVCSMEAKELKNMRSGFKYFEDWCLDVSGGNWSRWYYTDFFLGMAGNLKHQYYYYISLTAVPWFVYMYRPGIYFVWCSMDLLVYARTSSPNTPRMGTILFQFVSMAALLRATSAGWNFLHMASCQLVTIPPLKLLLRWPSLYPTNRPHEVYYCEARIDINQ